jgi:hypothetical protein
VVAVKPSGNVYSWDAVEELNIKRKNWTDLLTGENFTRKDVGSAASHACNALATAVVWFAARCCWLTPNVRSGCGGC